MPDKYGIPSADDLVIFIAKGGYENELALAKATFKEGQVLTLALSEVGRWYSKLSFEGF